jgi:hypothetical protein
MLVGAIDQFLGFQQTNLLCNLVTSENYKWIFKLQTFNSKHFVGDLNLGHKDHAHCNTKYQ